MLGRNIARARAGFLQEPKAETVAIDWVLPLGGLLTQVMWCVVVGLLIQFSLSFKKKNYIWCVMCASMGLNDKPVLTSLDNSCCLVYIAEGIIRVAELFLKKGVI